MAKFLISLFLSLSLTPAAHAYYGKHSSEAKLEFEAQADIVLSGAPTVSDLNDESTTKHSKALERVDAQIQHLMGSFQSESFKRKFRFPGVLGETYKIRFKKIEDGSASGRKLVTYKFTGKVVFKKEAFKRDDSRVIPITLPLAADLIYAMGLDSRGVNKCTDEHYNDESDFWYFWDPEMDGCALKGDTENVLRIKGTLTELENTTETYPEYDKLYGANGNGKYLDIAVFLGFIDDVNSLRRPPRHDNGTIALEWMEDKLTEQGFVENKDVRKERFRVVADGKRMIKGINELRYFEKDIKANGTDVTVRVQMLLADTAIASRDETFHHYLIPAFRKADVVIYDGHSGLGGNLDLRSLPRTYFSKTKYQVFYFNGCSSYPYFNGMFFDAKGGSKNLDVITSGLPTLTDSTGPNVWSLIDAFDGGKTPSWQKILNKMESSNGENGTYLTGVNGDEDNSWAP